MLFCFPFLLDMIPVSTYKKINPWLQNTEGSSIRSRMHSSEIYASHSSLLSQPLSLSCGAKILLLEQRQERDRMWIQEGRRWGSLGAPITALHTAQGWLMHTTPALGGLFGIPDAHPWKSWILYSFHSRGWSSQRKAYRAKKLLLKGKLPEIWESTWPHNISSLKREFQVKISASLSTLQPISIRVSTLRHVTFLLGHSAVDL